MNNYFVLLAAGKGQRFSQNKPKEIIYFLFAIDPLTFILFLIEFLTSTKIKTKNNNKKEMFKIRTNCKFC